ncbi:hypothetical protein Y032_0248g79 [Ancylostoma ceylanicum]|uniref:Uncharacterized protein n=1 Tax=Ancylostoma ceylanicum TaxID=53326 RepID=A0A016SCE4_9BILA|nr:hypothetical protein Y032_0248g79 [Ancylostoma ceylanicum]
MLELDYFRNVLLILCLKQFLSTFKQYNVIVNRDHLHLSSALMMVISMIRRRRMCVRLRTVVTMDGDIDRSSPESI